MSFPNGILKKRLKERNPVLAAWTSLGHPSITEAFTQAHVDFVGIDLEHSTISLEQAQSIIATAHAGGAACLPRAASHNKEQIARLLDSGADGIIVPNVETPDQVDQIVGWYKYPPLGKRSYGVARAQDYGFRFEEYAKTWNERSILLIQIESVIGAEGVEDLIKSPDVDGVMIGPYDISGSLGVPGELDHPKVQALCSKVVDACQAHGKACGTQVVVPTEASVNEAFSAGYSFTVLASDVFVLWKWAESMRPLIRAQHQSDSMETTSR